MEAIVQAADIQDRDGGVLLMATDLFGMYPFLLKLYADAGYQGRKFQTSLARACRAVNVEIVRRCDTGKFVVFPPAASSGYAAGSLAASAQALDRGTHDRLAQPMPPPQQGLGVPEPKRTRVSPLGFSAADAATPLPNLTMILDRL
jgi:hypothetical protein